MGRGFESRLRLFDADWSRRRRASALPRREGTGTRACVRDAAAGARPSSRAPCGSAAPWPIACRVLLEQLLPEWLDEVVRDPALEVVVTVEPPLREVKPL